MTVQDEIRQRIEKDVLLARLRRKIDTGKADFNDTFLYSDRAGKLLGEIFSRRLPDIPLEEREALCVELLRDRYTDINQLIDRVQRVLDEALNLHIAPQHAPFKNERAHKIGNATADPTVPVETQQRRAESAPATMTRAMHDDRMKKEADFRSRAGLQCYISRKTDGKCCEWCDKMAGRYEYHSEPKDVYRRHDNCGCSVTYENGRQRQNVWSKREWEAPAEGAGAGELTVLTEKQAKELQEKHQPEVLTSGRNRAKMNTEYSGIDLFKGADTLTEQDAKALNDSISVIPDNLLKKLSAHVSGIEVEEGRGYSSYNRETRRIILDKKNAAKDFPHELGHAFGEMVGVYEDPEFLRIIANGLDLQDWRNVFPELHPIDKTIVHYYKGPGRNKFVLPYQGRIYAQPDDIGQGNIDPTFFREYISVGFDCYFNRPHILQRNDPDLYRYLEVLINGFTGSGNEG